MVGNWNLNREGGNSVTSQQLSVINLRSVPFSDFRGELSVYACSLVIQMGCVLDNSGAVLAHFGNVWAQFCLSKSTQKKSKSCFFSLISRVSCWGSELFKIYLSQTPQALKSYLRSICDNLWQKKRTICTSLRHFYLKLQSELLCYCLLMSL